jgi:exopolyphosphatase/guanosine-5'-triphosphate,3'-diphosphate pyrophosphatase
VDIGTNSVRLLITDGAGKELCREMQITRLGQGVDVDGALASDAMARTVSVLEAYGARIREHEATRVRATATSAARDARNREAFFDAAEKALGARPELLPGEEEARLSFAGATFGLDPREGPFLIVDIGGGSTELVVGTTEPEALISLDMGCVRMTERHLVSDRPTAAEIEGCFADIRRLLARARDTLPTSKAKKMIGLAGTVTSLGAMALGLRHYDASRTHGMTLTRDRVQTLFEELASVDLETRRTLLAEPKRADVIVGGAAVLLTLLRELDIRELTVSETDILDGLAASLR